MLKIPLHSRAHSAKRAQNVWLSCMQEQARLINLINNFNDVMHRRSKRLCERASKDIYCVQSKIVITFEPKHIRIGSHCLAAHSFACYICSVLALFTMSVSVLLLYHACVITKYRLRVGYNLQLWLLTVYFSYTNWVLNSSYNTSNLD